MEGFNQNQERERAPSLEVQRNESAKVILEKVETLLGGELNNRESISLNGRERPIETYVDTLVATAQAKLRAVEKAHQEAIQEGDYRKEEFSAKLFELVQAEENLAKRYAEMYSLYGENTTKIEAMTPGLAELIQSAKEMYAKR